jgi:hypothetical protein
MGVEGSRGSSQTRAILLPAAGGGATLAASIAENGEKPLDHGEYERRKRAIEEQLAADLELIRTAAHARLEALETLWRAAAAQGGQDTRNETPASAETQSAQPPDEVQAPGSPSLAPTAVVRRRGDVLKAILETFPHLPDDFDKADVVRLLGFEPSRPTLHRAWDRLLQEKKIAMSRHSDGRRPTRYRKLAAG